MAWHEAALWSTSQTPGAKTPTLGLVAMAYAQRSWFGLQPQCWAAEVTAINCHHSKPPVSRELVQHQKQRLSHQKPWFKAVRVPQRFSLIGLVWLHNQAARCSVIGQGAVSHTIQSLTPAPPGRVTAKTTTTVTTLWPHSKPGGRKCGKPHCSLRNDACGRHMPCKHGKHAEHAAHPAKHAFLSPSPFSWQPRYFQFEQSFLPFDRPSANSPCHFPMQQINF